MGDFLRQFVQGIADTWRRLGAGARVQLALAGILTLALIAAVVYFGGQAQYVQLYAGLDLDEAGQMAGNLNDMSIPSELRAGGTSIYVPVQHVSRAKAGLAQQGLPTQYNEPGFELFDNMPMTTNNFQMEINLQRAIQGKLQRHLNQLDFVKASAVHIHEEPQALFSDEQRPSKASVILDTIGDLTNTQVQAVLHVVSAFGGANLSPNNIAITRARDGKVYHSPVEDQFASLAGKKLEHKVDFERTLERKLMDMFHSTGINARFSVNATFDWTQEEIRREEVIEGADISTSSFKSETTTRAAPPGGPAGATANIPDELGSPGGEITETKQTDTIKNLEPTRTVTNQIMSPGEVQRVRVASFIEGGYTTNEETGDSEYVALTDETREAYEAQIRNIVGEYVEPTEISIFDQPFDTQSLDVAPAVASTPVWERPGLLNNVVNGILLVVAAFMVFFFVRRATAPPPEEEEEVIELPEASAAEMRRKEIMTEVERLSREDPATVASLLRTWMNEEET